MTRVRKCKRCTVKYLRAGGVPPEYAPHGARLASISGRSLQVFCSSMRADVNTRLRETADRVSRHVFASSSGASHGVAVIADATGSDVLVLQGPIVAVSPAARPGRMDADDRRAAAWGHMPPPPLLPAPDPPPPSPP